MDVVHFDNEEIQTLCLALDVNGTRSPIAGVSWRVGWAEGVISAAHVIQAARNDLRLEEE